MRFFVSFMTPVLALFLTFIPGLPCQTFDGTIGSTIMDDANDEIPPEESMSSVSCNKKIFFIMDGVEDETSMEKTILSDKSLSSIVKIDNKSPKYVEHEILRLNSKKVEELHLDGNGLTSLPNSIHTLSKIETMNLVNNGISNIDSIIVINLLPRLRNLVLSHNPLKTLKGLEAQRLEILEAGFCEIQDITGILPNSLPVLKTLNLTGNPLNTIDKLISDTLTDLILKKCSLSHLPPELFLGLSNLTYLDLEENGLKTMPDLIFSGKNKLRYLNLGKNHIKDLRNKWFTDMPNLETLYLHKNEITSVHELDLTALSALAKLNLAENKLTTIPNFETAAIEVNFSRNSIRNKKVWDLSKMAKLQRLDLSHNRLEGNCDVFRSTSLGILILGYNKLTILEKESISDLPNLSDINIKGNKISRGISPDIFQHNPNLINMELDDNPWICNCTELFPLYYYITSGQRTQTTHLICHSPKKARGHTWWEYCNKNWRGLLIAEDYIERGTMWMIVMSVAFGLFVIFGTMLYITYTFKKNRPAQIRDNTI